MEEKKGERFVTQKRSRLRFCVVGLEQLAEPDRVHAGLMRHFCSHTLSGVQMYAQKVR